MGTRITKLAVLVMLCTVGIGSSTRVLAQTEHVDGKWEDPVDWPLEAIHMILLKNGKVLCVYDRSDVGNQFMVFDPTTEETTVITDRPTIPGTNDPIRIFCSGHSQLPNGRVVFVGGGTTYFPSHNHIVIFDPDAPVAAPWSVVADMPEFVMPGGAKCVSGRENRLAIASATW